MSHELRTPSNAIIGYSEILAEGAKADQRGEDLKDTQKILVFGNHLLALINQMLDHAAVESGALPLKPVRTAIAPIVRDVAATAHPLARQNETKLEVIGEAMVDPFRLKQCLVNIVRNAAEFTPSGEVHISCARSVREGREWLIFTVEDRGLGMAPDTLERPFTPFMQADRSYCHAFKGTGLGLAITKRRVDHMNGPIDVTGALGVCAAMALQIPLPASAPSPTAARPDLAAA